MVRQLHLQPLLNFLSNLVQSPNSGTTPGKAQGPPPIGQLLKVLE